VTRQEVVTFLEEYALSYREDSSNGTDAFLRNRLRHHVMPLLEQENPQLAQNLSDMAMRLRVDGEFLEELSQPEYPVDVNLLRAMHPARRARILERLLKDSGVREPEAEHISLAEKLVFSEKPSARASFPGGIILRRRYEYLEAEADLPPLKTRVIPCPGEVELPELGLRLVCRESTEPVNEKERFTVPAGESLEVRSRCAGDEIRLSGGTKSLKKLFIDRKIPASNRDRIPVVANREGVLGVYGLGPDAEKYKDEPCWLICFENIER
jgi:tRNA(Ile)-lysidine synthase